MERKFPALMVARTRDPWQRDPCHLHARFTACTGGRITFFGSSPPRTRTSVHGAFAFGVGVAVGRIPATPDYPYDPSGLPANVFRWLSSPRCRPDRWCADVRNVRLYVPQSLSRRSRTRGCGPYPGGCLGSLRRVAAFSAFPPLAVSSGSAFKPLLRQGSRPYERPSRLLPTVIVGSTRGDWRGLPACALLPASGS